MNLKYKRAGIIVKPHDDVRNYLKMALRIMERLGVEVVLEKIAAQMLGVDGTLPREAIAAHCDIIILIGGDGTFLSAANGAVEHQIPVGGFNLGTLGFLTELQKEKLEEHLVEIFQGGCKISQRKMLSIKFKGETFLALNDVVASKGNIARITKLLLEVNGNRVTEFMGDGLIISTPTGSTAYSLSSGGPIVSPLVNGFIITPICPHALTFRPLVIPNDVTIKVKLLSENSEVFMTIDGQKVLPMDTGDYFSVERHQKNLNMIVSKEMHYFKLLNEKLNWGM